MALSAGHVDSIRLPLRSSRWKSEWSWPPRPLTSCPRPKFPALICPSVRSTGPESALSIPIIQTGSWTIPRSQLRISPSPATVDPPSTCPTVPQVSTRLASLDLKLIKTPIMLLAYHVWPSPPAITRFQSLGRLTFSMKTGRLSVLVNRSQAHLPGSSAAELWRLGVALPLT